MVRGHLNGSFVDNPFYSETDYRALLSSQGRLGGWVPEVIGGVIGGLAERLIGHTQAPNPYPIPPPPPQNGNGRVTVNIPDIGYYEPMGPNQPGIPYGGHSQRGYYNKKGRWINRKRPSMNPLNPRALKRAMRRVESFAGFAKRTISFTKRVRMKKRSKR